MIGILTVRTPVELRPKVMTAVMTVATMAGPFGFIAAGYLLRHVSLGSFFIGLPALLTLGGLAFAAVLLRHRETSRSTSRWRAARSRVPAGTAAARASAESRVGRDPFGVSPAGNFPCTRRKEHAMATETKSDLVEELSSQSTKAKLVELLGSRLRKDEISKLLDDDSDGTKEELLKKLASRTKDELIQAVKSRLTKDEIEKAVDAERDDSDEDESEDDGDERSDTRQQSGQGEEDDQDEDQEGGRGELQRRTQHVDDTDLDWSAELEWAPPPQPTPAPVTFAGAPPFMPGARVRVDLSGLPTLGIFLGKGASAAGTITGVNAKERTVRVYLDACFDGEKEIVLPPERVTLDR